MNNASARKIQAAWKSYKSKYQLTLFSGSADSEPKNLETIFKRYIASPLPKYLTEISVRSNFKPIASYTREYGYKSSVSEDKIRWNQLTFKGRVRGMGFSMNLFKSGKITMTGGYPLGITNIESYPSSLVRTILNATSGAIKLNSVTLQFYSGYTGNLQTIAVLLADYGAEYVQYEQEISSFIKIDHNGFQFRIFPTGVVQISKIKMQSHIKWTMNWVNTLLRYLYSQGKLRKIEKPKVKKFTSRPQKRKNNQIAPNVVSRATTCPEDKRPTPYSFGGQPIGPDYYIGANPQGLPCCYKIPKKTAYLRGKIISRFAELGIRIPPSTKAAFGIVTNNSNKPVNVSGHVSDLIFMNAPRIKKNDGNLVFKIGTRQCSRWPQAKLVDIAHRLGMVQITGKEKKDDICMAIRKYAVNHGLMRNPGNSIGNNVRINGRRNASHFTKNQLFARAQKVYRVTLNRNKTLANMVKNLKTHVNSLPIKFRTVYNSEIPPQYRNFFFNVAKANLMGKNENTQRRELKNLLRRIENTTPRSPARSNSTTSSINNFTKELEAALLANASPARSNKSNASLARSNKSNKLVRLAYANVEEM